MRIGKYIVFVIQYFFCFNSYKVPDWATLIDLLKDLQVFIFNPNLSENVTVMYQNMYFSHWNKRFPNEESQNLSRLA